jgi:hypothetical protein
VTETVSDFRALPDWTLNLYLYPIGAWGVLALVLFLTGFSQWALPLAYPLAVWQLALTAFWGTNLLRRLDRGELSNAEAHEGIRSVTSIVIGSALLPAIVFLANDPLEPEAWSLTVGTFVVAGLLLGLSRLLIRASSRLLHGLALAVAIVALPLSATGSVTVATFLGWYGTMVDVAPVPDQFKPPLPLR